MYSFIDIYTAGAFSRITHCSPVLLPVVVVTGLITSENHRRNTKKTHIFFWILIFSVYLCTSKSKPPIGM